MALYDEETSPIGVYAFGNIVGTPEPDLGDKLAWQAGLKLDNNQIAPMLEVIDQAINEYRQQFPSFPNDTAKLQLPFGPAKDADPDNPDGDKIESETETIFKFKRKLEFTSKKTGRVMQRSAPTIYDAKGTVVNDQIDNIGWGSIGRIYYKALPYTYLKKSGITLALEGFQIKELKAGGGSSSGPAAPIEGGGWEAPPSNSIDMTDDTTGNFFELDE